MHEEINDCIFARVVLQEAEERVISEAMIETGRFEKLQKRVRFGWNIAADKLKPALFRLFPSTLDLVADPYYERMKLVLAGPRPVVSQDVV